VLDRLVAADLVRPSSGTPSCGFAFRHPLVRRAVYDAAPPAWRLAAHERAAAVLERRGAAAVARAYHVARFARPADDAAIALLAEAAAATADTAPATSAHYYAAALQLVPDADAGRRASLLAPMARALTGAGRLADGRTTLLEVLDLLGPEPTAQRLELVVTCAQVETELGLHGEARRRLLAALAEAPPDGHAALTFELAVAAFHGGDGDELRERSHAATRAATAADDPLLLAGAEALAAVGALRLADAAGAHGALGRAEARLAELDDATLATRPTVLWNLALAQLFGDRFADAAATSARALTIVRRTGPGLASPLLVLRAVALHHLLDLDAALREIETAEEIARLQRVPRHLHLALSVRGAVQYDRGEVADAERVADECAGLQRELEASHMTRIGDSGLAATRVERDPARAIRDIVAAAGPRLEGAEPACRSWLLLQLVRAGVATGALADAERWAGEAAEAAVELRLPTSEARSTMARAEFLLARRDAGAAAALAERAVALAEGAPAPLDAADARLLAGRAHAAAGDTQRAKAALQQAAADAGRGGAVRLRDAAARELRRLGTRVSAESRRAAGPQRLTDRERRIAALVADGYSNKQAAATLFLSEKTIEGALTRV
jgi:DNA-binding CsgD family transcriptional regulator